MWIKPQTRKSFRKLKHWNLLDIRVLVIYIYLYLYIYIYHYIYNYIYIYIGNTPLEYIGISHWGYYIGKILPLEYIGIHHGIGHWIHKSKGCWGGVSHGVCEACLPRRMGSLCQAGDTHSCGQYNLNGKMLIKHWILGFSPKFSDKPIIKLVSLCPSQSIRTLFFPGQGTTRSTSVNIAAKNARLATCPKANGKDVETWGTI
jgi:hypothetical protein